MKLYYCNFSDAPSIESNSVKFMIESQNTLDLYTVMVKWPELTVIF